MSVMNWNDYRKLVDQKLQDTWENWNEAEKKALQARAAYEAVQREKDAFERALTEDMDKLEVH